MAKYLVLYQSTYPGSDNRWRVFDVVDSRNDHRLWYDYLKSKGYMPGLAKADDKDWIARFVEKS